VKVMMSTMGSFFNMNLGFYAWFPFIQIHNVVSYIILLFVIAVLAFCEKFLIRFIRRLHEKEVASTNTGIRRYWEKLSLASLQTLDQFVHYMLMLLVMSFNIGVLLAVLTGTLFGYLVANQKFSWWETEARMSMGKNILLEDKSNEVQLLSQTEQPEEACH